MYTDNCEEQISPEIILDIDLENGTKQKYELLTAYRAENENCYFALSPLDGNGEPQENVVELVRAVVFDNGEDYALERIDSDEELAIAQRGLDAAMTRYNAGCDDIFDIPGVVPLENGNGELENYLFVDAFNCNGHGYIVLISEAEANRDNVDMLIMRYEGSTQDDEKGFELKHILSEEEYEVAMNTFEARMSPS